MHLSTFSRLTPTITIALVASLVLLFTACQSSPEDKPAPNSTATQPATPTSSPASKPSTPPASAPQKPAKGFPDVDLAPEGMGIATFAGGCFWCMEKPFETIPGVTAVYSGYTGGSEVRPTYKEVAYGRTSHIESVRVVFDPKKVSYNLLLDVFWRNVNPTQADGQFVDRGPHYRTAIFTHSDEQAKQARASKDALDASKRFDKPIVTELLPASAFYAAETYHQDFYIKSPERYYGYRKGSGRDAYLKKVWGEEAGGYSLHKGNKTK